MLDYEPQYRPTWRFTTMATGTAPQWASFLQTTHTPHIDTNWTQLVGWPVPVGASGWASLTPLQQTSLQAVSWDFFVRTYLTAGLVAIKQAMSADARYHTVQLSVWNWPFKFWQRSNAADWDSMMDEMGWLWVSGDSVA